MRRKKIEPLMNTGYPIIDQMMNDGWEQFVNEIRDENDKWNFRLLRAIEKVKGELFVSELKVLLKRVDFGKLHITNKPIGMKIGENRFATIREVWINQKIIDGVARGSVCVQIKPNRWLIAQYAQ